jgi:hypothetical protein
VLGIDESVAERRCAHVLGDTILPLEILDGPLLVVITHPARDAKTTV